MGGDTTFGIIQEGSLRLGWSANGLNSTQLTHNPLTVSQELGSGLLL